MSFYVARRGASEGSRSVKGAKARGGTPNAGSRVRIPAF